jgi:hypothetical protein
MYHYTFISVRLVIDILLNKCNGFCRARLNRTLVELWVTESVYVHTSTTDAIRYVTYLIKPDVESSSGVISIPFSTTFEILNTASDMAVDIQTDASARWRPGQPREAVSENCLLDVNRRPLRSVRTWADTVEQS